MIGLYLFIGAMGILLVAVLVGSATDGKYGIKVKGLL